MPSQFSVIKEQILVVGDRRAGKSALIRRLATDMFGQRERRQRTVPQESISRITPISLVTETRWMNLRLIEVNPSSNYALLRPSIYQTADYILVCFDLSNIETAKSILRHWRSELQTSYHCATILLVGLKSDLEHAITRKTALRISRRIGAMRYFECSSLNGRGCREIFEFILVDT